MVGLDKKEALLLQLRSMNDEAAAGMHTGGHGAPAVIPCASSVPACMRLAARLHACDLQTCCLLLFSMGDLSSACLASNNTDVRVCNPATQTLPRPAEALRPSL